jgi:hypothetical protein
MNPSSQSDETTGNQEAQFIFFPLGEWEGLDFFDLDVYCHQVLNTFSSCSQYISNLFPKLFPHRTTHYPITFAQS